MGNKKNKTNKKNSSTREACPGAPFIQGLRWTHSEDEEEAGLSCSVSNKDVEQGVRQEKSS